MKTYKSIAKRFKITKKGKVIHKRPGQNHFRMKKRGKYILAKRRQKEIFKSYGKTIIKAMK